MDFHQLIDTITPEAYDNLKSAVETGKWPDGQPLSAAQRANCMQAVIAYETKHLPPEQRTGFIARKPDGACASPKENGIEHSAASEQAIKWQQ